MVLLLRGVRGSLAPARDPRPQQKGPGPIGPGPGIEV